MKKSILIAIAFLAAITFTKAQDKLMVVAGEKSLYVEHTVISGEGLYSVGRLFNVSPKHIAAFNQLDLSKGLEIGQVIRIPMTDINFTQKSNKGIPLYYTVNPGEGLYKVSSTYRKLPIPKIKEWNGLKTDNINSGSDLIVGFLISRPMEVAMKNAKPLPTEEKSVDQPVVTSDIARETKQPEKVEPVKIEPVKEVGQTEVAQKENDKDQPVARITKQDPNVGSQEPNKTEAVFAKDDSKNTGDDIGYFKPYFEQQLVATPTSHFETVSAGIFKTNSGWQDGKYYMLIDGVAAGSIVKVSNATNTKTIYAKVLGEMNGIRQNQGLTVRISNAGAAALGIADVEKFTVSVNY